MSAAHCVHNSDYARYVIVGEHDQQDLDDGQIFIKVKEIHIHPFNDPQHLAWDFAILVLEEEVEYTEKVQPIILPQVKQDIALISIRAFSKTNKYIFFWGVPYCTKMFLFKHISRCAQHMAAFVHLYMQLFRLAMIV